jgi:hypothetical protein
MQGIHAEDAAEGDDVTDKDEHDPSLLDVVKPKTEKSQWSSPFFGV